MIFIVDQYAFPYSDEYTKGYATYHRRSIIIFDFAWCDDFDLMYDMV